MPASLGRKRCIGGSTHMITVGWLLLLGAISWCCGRWVESNEQLSVPEAYCFEAIGYPDPISVTPF